MDHIDAVVIGAGVVGLAVGRALAHAGRETVVLERAGAIGTETSSRNSEVIHAGLYYATHSQKARLCVQGRDQLYAYCREHAVAHRRCGKLVVATETAQHDALQRLHAQAQRNGVADVRWLTGEQARAMEPALHATAALHSPSTGIIDSHALMLALQGDLEAAGGMVAFRSEVVGLRCGQPHILQVQADGEESELSAAVVINAAGLWAPLLAARMQGLPQQAVPRHWYAKGNYFSLAAPARVPFTHLIYPVPSDGGLGVHLTLDLAGQARFGPDVQWLDQDTPQDIDYRVDPARGLSFNAEIRRYWPGLPDQALQPDYSGVRPKLVGPGGGQADFVIQGAHTHGWPGLVQLLGIESPGLTSCLAIAQAVVHTLATDIR